MWTGPFCLKPRTARVPDPGRGPGLDAGDWLLPGAVAVLLGVDRSTVVRMLNADPPVIRYRYRSGRGRYWELNPEDVRSELSPRREVHGSSGRDAAPVSHGGPGPRRTQDQPEPSQPAQLVISRRPVGQGLHGMRYRLADRS